MAKSQRSGLDWDDIRPFLAVARTGSLSAAARRLRTTPSRVARRVAALEAALAQTLFLRSPDGYALTDEGRALLPAAEEVESGVGRILARAGGGDAVQGLVRVATSDMFARAVIAPRIGTLLGDFPDLRLEIVAGVRFVELMRFEVDLALRMGRPTAGPFKVRRLARMDFALYAGAQAAARGGPVPGIGWTEGFADLPAAQAMSALGLTVALRANGMAIQMEAARAGAGAAILPCFIADRDPDLVRMTAPLPMAAQDVWLVTNADLAGSRRVQAVAAWIADCVAAALPAS